MTEQDTQQINDGPSKPPSGGQFSGWCIFLSLALLVGGGLWMAKAEISARIADRHKKLNKEKPKSVGPNKIPIGEGW